MRILRIKIQARKHEKDQRENLQFRFGENIKFIVEIIIIKVYFAQNLMSISKELKCFFQKTKHLQGSENFKDNHVFF